MKRMKGMKKGLALVNRPHLVRRVACQGEADHLKAPGVLSKDVVPVSERSVAEKGEIILTTPDDHWSEANVSAS